jgi:hypothetical protein
MVGTKFQKNSTIFFPGLVTVTKIAQAARLLPCVRVGPRSGIDWETDCCNQGFLFLDSLTRKISR